MNLFKKVLSFLGNLFSTRRYRIETVVSVKVGNDWHYIGKRTTYKWMKWQKMEKWLSE